MPRFLWFEWGSEEPVAAPPPYPEHRRCPKCKAKMHVEHLLPLPMEHMILVDYRCDGCGFLETGIFERPPAPGH